MRGGDPLHAILGAMPMSLAGMQALVEAGVPAALVSALHIDGDMALARVDVSRDGSRFSFGGPDKRLILAVRDGTGGVVDLVALSSARPDEWALHLGHADFLGTDCLEQAVAANWRHLRVFPTPMAWLRAGGRGVCVLDWNIHALNALRGLGTGVTLVVDAGAKLKMQAMLAHGGLPLVAEDRPDLRRAA